MKEFIISKNDAGQRLDRFIPKVAPLLPSSLLQKYIRLKRFKLDGKAAQRDFKLSEGQHLCCYINDEFFDRPTDGNAHLAITSPKLDVVFEDNNILLANKPVGMLCHSAGQWTYNTLVANIQAYLRLKGEWRPGEENSFAPALCNRIDRNTQGIVIAAKTAEALRILNEKIKAREIDKRYLCIVSGAPRPAAGTLSGYLFKDAVKNQVYIRSRPEPGAKTSVTKYRTLAVENGLALLECELVTGRTHQIRAQLSAAGFPLLGDGKYGAGEKNRAYGENAQALCSYRLKFKFATDAGVLNYLNGREFFVQNVDFVQKYFSKNIFVDI